MNLVLSFSFLSSKIVKVEQSVNPYTKGQHLQVYFSNGYSLSIPTGADTYSDSTTYEVAVKRNGRLDYEHTDGDVLTWQTVQQIHDLAIRISSL